MLSVVGVADLPSLILFFFKQKTAYEMRISDWSSDVCSSDLLEPVAAAAREVVRLRGERTALTEMLADPEMKAMAEEELEAVAAALPAAEHALAVGLLPKDVADERAAMLEIRAGTGGDEAALFAGDLLRMYSRYADTQRSEEHTSELQSLMRISYAVFC